MRVSPGRPAHSRRSEARRVRRAASEHAVRRRCEGEEAFRCLVVPCAVKVGVVCEHAEDPAERRGKLVPVSAGVEVA